MVDALFDLEKLLLSEREQVTIQETNLLRAWKARARIFFYLGLGGGSAVAWLATQRLQRPLRHVLMGGAGIVCGSSLCARSLESSVEHILSIEGSRVQREMANILLKKYRHDDPWAWRLVSKHFYPEVVYEDSSADKPVFRWRYRNFSGESATRSQSTTTYGGEETNPKEKKNDNTPKLKPEQQTSVTAAAVTEDPFDLVLGGSESADNDDPQPTNAPLEPSRRQMRKEKLSRRRHRKQRRREESDNE